LSTRKELYERKDVRLVLGWITSGREDIRPEWNREGHNYTYREPDRLLGKSSAELLEELAKEKLLERYDVDEVVECPRCNSGRDLRDRYLCLFCDSTKLQKGTLIEHYDCGHVDFVERFSRVEGLACPKCDRPLKLIGTDYRRLENIFRCENCKKDSSVPKIVHNCSKCNFQFNHEEASLRRVYGYKFVEDFRGEVTVNCTVERPLVELLKEMGYSVEAPKILTGRSGADHAFDIVGERHAEQIVISLTSDPDGVAPDAVASFFGRLLDVRPDRSLLVAMPKLTAQARNMAALYKIETLEGKTLSDVMEQMRKTMRQTGQVAGFERAVEPPDSEKEFKRMTDSLFAFTPQMQPPKVEGRKMSSTRSNRS